MRVDIPNAAGNLYSAFNSSVRLADFRLVADAFPADGSTSSHPSTRAPPFCDPPVFEGESMKLSRAVLLCLGVLLNGGLLSAQENSRNQKIAGGAPTITVATTGERVRFTAPSHVVRLRVEVLSESGTSLFDISSKGNVFDWTLLDGNGERVVDGLFLCVVTVKSLSGKISQRAGTISVQGGMATLRPEA